MAPGREFDLIRRMIRVWGDLASGIGSDTAHLKVPAGSQLVASTDSSIEGVHFRRDWLTPKQIGYRATAAALSDLAAAAATPIGVLIALNVPASWLDDVEGIAEGVGDAARDCGARILGGDTSAASQLSLTVTVIGAASRPLSRAGSRVGDRIVLTGDVGRSATALAKLRKGETPTADEMERFAHPAPRIAEGLWLAAHGATAAIDVSDGLGSELAHLSTAGDVRLRVELDATPMREGGTPAITALDALSSGEEYELLVTVPDSFPLDSFRAAFSTRITEIGRVVAGTAGVDLMSHGQLIALPRGHDHF